MGLICDFWGSGKGGCLEMEVEKPAEEFSKEELRRQLYSSLRSTGVLDSMKVFCFFVFLLGFCFGLLVKEGST